jgi:hypothetical protein
MASLKTGSLRTCSDWWERSSSAGTLSCSDSFCNKTLDTAQAVSAEEILSGQGGTQAQTESKEAHSINYKRELHGRELHEVAKSV